MVDDFLKNEGPALQQKLVDYAAGRAVSGNALAVKQSLPPS